MNSNKRRHKTNKEFAKGWPLTLDNSLLESLKRNVPAREAEFLEEVELYRAKWTGQGSSSSNLISTILQYNDRFPADSFISRLYANPQSILFLFNLIPSLLSTSGSGTPLAHRGRSEVLEFIIKFLFRSLVRHSHVVLSFNKKLDGSLVNLSMGMTHHVQTVFSGNQGLAVVMSLCTSLLVMLSSRSAGYVRNILSNTEVVSGSLSLEYDCFCKTPSRESSYLENKLVQRFPFQSNIKLGNFISCLRYLEGVASLYLLNAERPSFLTPGMRMAAEKTIMSVSVAVLEQMDKLLGLYFPQYKHEHPFGDYSLLYEDEGARLRLLDHIAPIIVQASLKWVAVSQEVSIRRFGDFNKSSHLDMSRFPNILKMVILPIKRDHVSDEISDTLLAFMESCSEHLCLSNKCSVPVSVISGNILVSSLRLSGSISRDMATFAWREEMFSAGTGANRVKILIKYLKVFSPTIVPLLLIFDLMGIPLNSDLSKLEFEDPSLMELYREWQNTCSSVFMSIALETISKVSKISRVKRLTFPAPVMITCRQDCPTGLMSANNDGICLGMDNGLEMQMDLGFDLGLHLDFEPEIPGGIMDFGSETILNPGLLFIPETLGSSESDLGFSPMSRGSTHSRVPLIMDPVQIPELGRHQHRYLHFNQQPLADFPDLSSSLGKESGHVFQKFRREIHSLICGLSLITLRGSSEQMLLSISAWGSICSSLRISSSCSHHLQSLFEDLNGARFRPLGGYLNRIRDLNKGGSAVVSTDMGDIGLIGIQRYFIWSTVEMGEYPEELYHFEGRLDSLVARFSERKSSHLKVRESIRDVVRSAIFFPEPPSPGKTTLETALAGRVTSSHTMREDGLTRYILPFYSFQMFLKDTFLHLNGFRLTRSVSSGQIKMRASNRGTRNIQVKSFIANLESILHAFSAIIKRGLTSFPVKAGKHANCMTSGEIGREKGVYGSEEEIRSLLDLVSVSLSLDSEEAVNRDLGSRGVVLGAERDYFEQTRILFDAVMLKILQVAGELEGLMDVYLRIGRRRREVDDREVLAHEGLFRQFLCTLTTLLGVSSVWFDDKSVLVTLKGLRHIFRSLLLAQEDQFFPLALEQDHVGALALLKLSQNKTCFEEEILDYMVINCMDSFSRLFSDSSRRVEGPTMTVESYLILVTSLGICISHLISDFGSDVASSLSDQSSPRSVSATTSSSGPATDRSRELLVLHQRLQKWKKYVGLVLEKYLYLVDKLIGILSAQALDLEARRGGGDHQTPPSGEDACQIYSLLLVTYMMLCGIEAFFSSIFPCKYRPYSYVILTIGAEKFCHLGILEYSKRLFESETSLRHSMTARMFRDASSYVLGFFSRDFYSRIRLILRLSCAISPDWLQVLYHPYTCIMSCMLQLPFLSPGSTAADGDSADLLLGLYRYIGYDEFRFLLKDHMLQTTRTSPDHSVLDYHNNTSLLSNGHLIGTGNHGNSSHFCLGVSGTVAPAGGSSAPKALMVGGLGGRSSSCLCGENEGAGSVGVLKKGLHPVVTFIYKLQLFNGGLGLETRSIIRLLQSSFPQLVGSTGVSGAEAGGSTWGFVSTSGNYQKGLRDVFSVFKGDLASNWGQGVSCHDFDMCSVYDKNLHDYKDDINEDNDINVNSNSCTKVCICSYVPNIFLPLSVMMLRIPYLTWRGKHRFLDPVLSFIHSFKTFNVHPIIHFLSYYSVSVSTMTSMNRDDYKLHDSVGHFRHFKKDSGLHDLNRLNTFCMYVNQMSSADGALRVNSSRVDDHCSCLDYHDGVCLILLLILQNLTSMSADSEGFGRTRGGGGGGGGLGGLGGGGGGAYGASQSHVKIVGTQIRANLDAFLEYTVSRCIVTLLICIGTQCYKIQKRMESERAGGSPRNASSLLMPAFEEDRCTRKAIGQGTPVVDGGGAHTREKRWEQTSRGAGHEGSGCRDAFFAAEGGDLDEAEAEPEQADEPKPCESERFVPQKLLSNQKWMVATIKYLLGPEFTSKVSKQHVEKFFTNSVWGVELTTTILLAILESYCDSESFTILSDILILIRQLLDKRRFKSLLETSFCRLPIRMLVQSVHISAQYPSLCFPLIGGAKVSDFLLRVDFEGDAARTNRSNYHQKSKNSMISCTIRQLVCRLLEENYLLSSNPTDPDFPRGVGNGAFDLGGNSSFACRGEFLQMHEDILIGGHTKWSLPYILKSPASSDIIKEFIQQIVNVTVSQTNKTRFRQILKEFCVRSICRRVDE